MTISLGEANLRRREQARVGFPHRYTRTPYTKGPDNSEGNASRVPGADIPGLPCKYRANETLRTDEGGRTTIYRPSLSIPHDALLEIGDLVGAVTSSDSVELLKGPLAVESIRPNAAFGPTLSKRAYLRAGDAR